MELVPHLQQVVASYGYLAVFLIVALESAGIPMPGETVLVTAAIFAASGTLKIYWVIGAAAAGAIIGDNCGYWIGRELGFPLIYRFGHYIRLDEKRLKVGQYLFLRHGGKIIFFGRFVAVLRAFAAFLAGVNRYNWEEFFLYNAAGGIVWATIFGAGGYLLGRAFEHYARPVGIAAPSITRSTMPWRLTASDRASRTRRSISGFLSNISPFGPVTKGVGPVRD